MKMKVAFLVMVGVALLATAGCGGGGGGSKSPSSSSTTLAAIPAGTYSTSFQSETRNALYAGNPYSEGTASIDALGNISGTMQTQELVYASDGTVSGIKTYTGTISGQTTASANWQNYSPLPVVTINYGDGTGAVAHTLVCAPPQQISGQAVNVTGYLDQSTEYDSSTGSTKNVIFFTKQ